MTPFAHIAAGALIALMPTAVAADQFRMAADNARIDCQASKKELTRISLVGDQFASVSKVSTGVPYNDFSVVNEPVRGDIYLSVPDAYAAHSINFFATSKKGYVYKFVCEVAPVEAQQIFITNPALAQNQARAWEEQTPIETTVVRLIRAMATSATIDGYELRQPNNLPVNVAGLSVRLVAEYRGAALVGKALRIENRTNATIVLREADLAPQGTLAVTIAKPELAPGEATSAWLVGQAGGE